jgi:hypothetical protein
MKLFMSIVTVLTHKSYFFLLHNFRARFEHFCQSKSTSIIKWKLFSGFKTPLNSMFIRVWVILVKLFTSIVTVLTYESYFFLLHNFRARFEHFYQSKSTSIIKWKLFSESETPWNSMFIRVWVIIVKLLTSIVTVLTYKFYFFCSVTSKRILSTFIKANRLPLLSESCSAGPKLLESRFS